MCVSRESSCDSVREYRPHAESSRKNVSWRSKPVPEPTTDTIGLTAIADLAPVLLLVGFALCEPPIEPGCSRHNCVQFA